MKKSVGIILCVVICMIALNYMQAQNSGGVPQEPSKFTSNTISNAEAPIDNISYEIVSKKVVLWNNIFGDQKIQTIIEIKNTGECNIKLKSVSYELEDSTGKFLGVFDALIGEYPNILEPGEVGIIYHESALDFSLEAEPTILLDVKAEPTNLTLKYFPVSDFQIVEGQWGKLKMLGRVENTSSEKLSDVCVCVLLYDDKGNLIGANDAYIYDIDAGSKKGFDSTFYSLPDFVDLETIASWKVFAYDQ